MKRLRWYILGMLFFASVINYIDRQSLSILAPTIQKDLGIDDIGYSHIVQMFLLAYSVSFLVAGWITDKLGSRVSMALFIGWWSVANMLTGFVGSLRGLAATRFMLGAGESGLYVVAPKVVSQLFPAKERGLAVGIYSAGATLGATFAPPLIAVVTFHHGWRAVFVAGGVLGLMWIVPWVLGYRDEKPEPRGFATSPSPGTPGEGLPVVDASAVNHGGSPHPNPLPAYRERGPEDSENVSWLSIFLSRDVLLLLAIRAITDPVWQFILFWFPKYMVSAHHQTLEQVGKIGWVPYLAADIGGILGGYASGLLIPRGFAPATSRKALMAVCAVIIPAVAIITPLLPTAGGVAFTLAVVAFAEFTWMVTMTALAVDVLPSSRVGRGMGIIAAGSGAGGVVFSGIVGHLVTSYSYTPVFVLMAVLHPLAMILLFFVGRSKGQRQTPEKLEAAMEGAAS